MPGMWQGSRLPYNLEAEQALLGGILIAPEQFDVIEGRLEENDFFAPSHGKVFAAMRSLRRQQQPIDPVLLRNELKARNDLDGIGGVVGLAALTDSVVSGAHVEHYAKIVQDCASLRRLMKVCSDAIAAASSSEAVALDVISEAEKGIQDAATRNFHGNVLTAEAAIKNVWAKIQSSLADNRLISGLSTGFIELDQKLTGMHGGELIIIAGRPAMGKSTFALNVLRNVGVAEGLSSIVFTLEMSSENIIRNILAAQAKVEGQKLRTNHFSREDMERLGEASAKLMDAAFMVDDTPAISLAELRGKARQLSHKHDLKLVVIDYLQLMTASAQASKRSREQEVSEISRGLKALAKELDIPVIALSQLSRKPDNRQDSRPVLSDLRESGAIEQDADVVLMLHRPEYYKPDDRPGEAEVIIAKQRNGPTGSVPLAFISNQLRFENLAPNAGFSPTGDM